MDSVFEIIGPPMIGPSSSHTAGAARIGLAARYLLGATPTIAKIGLHGSFAATGHGHATDRAIVAGLLGFAPDDERLKNALVLASEAGLDVEFATVDLGEEMHPNSAKVDLGSLNCIASSVGGGSIEIVEIDGFATRLGCTLDTLVFWHEDKSGFLAHVTAVLACVRSNIATIRTTRRHRGSPALTAVELDSTPPTEATALLAKISHVTKLRAIPPLG